MRPPATKTAAYAEAQAFVTKDGSIIRELIHPTRHGNHNQSLAEAIVPHGTRTLRHLHRHSEELYHITAGQGLMTLDATSFSVAPGDTVLILPGTPHCIENTGTEDLKILCCCAPAYSHGDTDLLE